jgi:hypothetical protein
MGMRNTTAPRIVIVTLTEADAALVERTLHEKIDWLNASGEPERASELADICFEILCAASDAGVEFPEY